MLSNYFQEGEKDMWNICFREYDGKGNLTELISVKSKKIKNRWSSIQKFLKSCGDGRTREVQFCRNSRQQPSLISSQGKIFFGKPIVAMLPLFEYANERGILV